MVVSKCTRLHKFVKLRCYTVPLSNMSMGSENMESMSFHSKESFESSGKQRRRFRRKKEDVNIVISLWINGVSYEHGKLCTFCEKSKAVFYCPDCKDFYCDPCDHTVHKHSKRSWHERSIMSKYSLDDAAHICTRAMRFLQHLKLLQRLARDKIRRIYDGKTFNHYYFNTVYGTSSWKRPYCLRGSDLHPHLTRYEAASIIQGLHRGWVARSRAIREIEMQYSKIFHRGEGHYYYAFTGKSRLLPRQSWKKPMLLGCRGYPKDLDPVRTDDYFALIIQRKWRVVLVRKHFRALVRIYYRRDWNPLVGKYVYVNLNTGVSSTHKPRLLGSEAWDPKYVPDWDVQQVVLFFRRLGLGRYKEIIMKYAIDGRLLLLFKATDFLNVGVESSLHIKKILLALEDTFPTRIRDIIPVQYHIRLEKIRKHGVFDDAATHIQKAYRGHIGRLHAKYTRHSRKVQLAEAVRREVIDASAPWWTEQMLKMEASGKLGKFIQSQGKNFGRYKEHLTVNGWGRYDQQGFKTVANDSEDGNPTRRLTEKLIKSGYDERRFRSFVESKKGKDHHSLVVYK